MGNTIDSLSDLIRARQHQRILRLSFPNDDGPRCEFVVERLEAEEHMSRPFVFTVGILSDRANIGLKDIHGRLISIALVQQAGTLRYFTGYCLRFRLVKAENIAHYEAVLGPVAELPRLPQGLLPVSRGDTGRPDQQHLLRLWRAVQLDLESTRRRRRDSHDERLPVQ